MKNVHFPDYCTLFFFIIGIFAINLDEDIMPYINYNTFIKFANPSIIEQLDELGGFAEYEELVASVVYQLTHIDVPNDPNETPKWLVFNIVAIMQKTLINKMQQVSEELRKQINDDYEKALASLRAYKIPSNGDISSLTAINGVLNSRDANTSEWSAYS